MLELPNALVILQAPFRVLVGDRLTFRHGRQAHLDLLLDVQLVQDVCPARLIGQSVDHLFGGFLRGLHADGLNGEKGITAGAARQADGVDRGGRPNPRPIPKPGPDSRLIPSKLFIMVGIVIS